MVLFLPRAWADAHIDILNASGFPASTTIVGVNFSSTSNAVGANFRVTFDPAKLQFVSAQAGNAAIAAGKDVASELPSSNVVSIVVFGLNNNVIPDGRLVNLNFIIKSSATVGSKLALVGSNQASTDTNAQAITTTISDGEITVTQCVAPSAPTNFKASDGSFGDRVELTWNPANGASSYKLYRNNSNSFATASTLGVTTDTKFSDFGAIAASLVSSGGCGSASTLSYTSHYYWVIAQNSCGSSAPVGADTGFRGGSKAVAAGGTFEPVLPVNALESGIAPDDAIAIRLRAGEPIASVWGYVSAEGFDDNNVEWIPADRANANDGWVVYRPDGMWIPGEIVTLIAGGETAGGETLGPLTVALVVHESKSELEDSHSANVKQPGYSDFDAKGLLAADEASNEAKLSATPAGSIPAFPGVIGDPVRIAPDGPFTNPHRVWLPVSNGVSADAVSVYYYQGGAGSGAWFSADSVEGWFIDGSPLILDLAGVTYYGFLVNYGGVVALGVTDAPAMLSSASLSPTADALAGFPENVLLLAAVLGILGFSQYRTSRRRQREAGSVG
jgi:hypothetical protein